MYQCTMGFLKGGRLSWTGTYVTTEPGNRRYRAFSQGSSGKIHVVLLRCRNMRVGEDTRHRPNPYYSTLYICLLLTRMRT